MQKTVHDRPNVIIFPPVILATTVALGCMVQWLLPLNPLDDVNQILRVTIGAVVLLVGVSIAAAGRTMLRRLGTNVSPLRPTTALATDGIYRWTRNPLYTGGTLVMLGVALVLSVDWLVLFVVPSVFVLHFGVVRREEQYLEQKFGEAYRRYKAKVSRYGLGI